MAADALNAVHPSTSVVPACMFETLNLGTCVRNFWFDGHRSKVTTAVRSAAPVGGAPMDPVLPRATSSARSSIAQLTPSPSTRMGRAWAWLSGGWLQVPPAQGRVMQAPQEVHAMHAAGDVGSVGTPWMSRVAAACWWCFDRVQHAQHTQQRQADASIGNACLFPTASTILWFSICAATM